MSILENLEPKQVFHFFEEISKIPRGSGNETSVSDYVVHFAEERGLYCFQDEAKNVVVKKPASPGFENAQGVILQGHLDMVCEKNESTEHDFTKDALDLQVENGFIHANGTTLGADNGIAVAYMLAVLDDKTLEHPPLEALFTVGEEVGMTGAEAFDTSILQGTRLINMDTEEEGNFVVSCCGGRRVTIELPIVLEKAPQWGVPFFLKISGLKGGHSGSDIHLHRANANQLMGNVLFTIANVYEHRMAFLDGGLMDNAIPREASAVLLFHEKDVPDVRMLLSKIEKAFQYEYRDAEEDIQVTLEPLEEKVLKVFSMAVEKQAIYILQLTPNGIVTMCDTEKDLVESSNNLGIVNTEKDVISFHNALRSSTETMKLGLFNQLCTVSYICSAKIKYAADYPAWEYRPDSKLLELFTQTYRDLYKKEPQIEAIHAGLECGLFHEKMPEVDLISVGPNMYGVHSPDEKLDIESTARVWEFLKEVLKRMK